MIKNDMLIGSDIYLDAQGTERPRPESVQAVVRCLSEDFGNPSALSHNRGRRACQMLEGAREGVAELMHAEPDGVIFTSGATEANNLVLRSFVKTWRKGIVVSSIEHKSVLTAAESLREDERRVSICPVDRKGVIDLGALESLIDDDTALVSVMHANNELGTLQPVQRIVEICRRRGAMCHVDASQTVGRIPIDFAGLGVDFLTLSGHKFGAPTGVGALLARPRSFGRLNPQIVGGGQESGLRAGTTPIAQCVGLAAALSSAVQRCVEETERQRELRDRLVARLGTLPGFFLNGSRSDRLPCNFNGGFDGIDSLLLMRRMPNIHFSTGSACTTGAMTNHVLDAIGLPKSRQRSTIRISLSWSTTTAHIEAACCAFEAVVPELARAA